MLEMPRSADYRSCLLTLLLRLGSELADPAADSHDLSGLCDSCMGSVDEVTALHGS